jgi:alpha-L-fucosidase
VVSRRAALRALRRRRLPAWWRDAKLGIFVHWTPASVVGFAPVDSEIAELLQSGRRDALAWSPYTEWYENSLRFPDSPAARHHREIGAPAYAELVARWEAALDGWDPDQWARRFAATGARYVVLVAKHHDGYCLWPSRVTNPHRAGCTSSRDVVGELAEAVRAANMRFGVYYSGGLDWTFDDRPIGSFADMLAAIPRGDYAEYATAQVQELIERYRPSVLWNDIAWPAPGASLWELFGQYYDAVPDGVVNDRWMPWSPALAVARLAPVQRAIDAGVRRQARRDAGVVPPEPPHFDVRTPEYTVFPDVRDTPWECVRGMDMSFGYNAASRPEHFVDPDELVWSFVDIVAKGGNLLLNVGPRGVDAGIPDEQLARLETLGSFLQMHAATLYATRPWITAGNTTAEGVPVRYSARDASVYAFVRRDARRVTLREVASTPTTDVTATDGASCAWSDSDRGLVVDVPAGAQPPYAFELRSVRARSARVG